MQANIAYRPLHAATYAPAHLALPQPGAARRALCTAGLAALLVAGSASLAQADPAVDLPGSDWNPDVPSIDGGAAAPSVPDSEGAGDSTGGSDGTDQAPSDPAPSEPVDPPAEETPSEPAPELPADPAPEAPVQPEPDAGNQDVYIPDSSTSVPSYDETYGSGSTSSVGASEGSWFDPAVAVADEVAPDQTVEEAPAMPVATPVFGSYDEVTRLYYGTAQPGSLVRVMLADGTHIEDVWTDEAGSFVVWIPDWCGLWDVSMYVIDEWGNQLSDVLTGAASLQVIAQRERETVRAAVGESTSALAAQFAGGLSATGVASNFADPTEEGMPVLPYVLGAASALVAAGAVGAAVVALRRRDGLGREVLEESPASQAAPAVGKRFAAAAPVGDTGSFAPASTDRFAPAPDMDSTGSFAPATPVADRLGYGFAAGGTGAFAPSAAPSQASGDTLSFMPAAAPASTVVAPDNFDDLEAFAMGFAGAVPADSSAPANAPSEDPVTASIRANLAGLSAEDTFVRVAVPVAPTPGPNPDPEDDPTPPRGPSGGAPLPSAGAGDTAAFLAVAPAASPREPGAAGSAYRPTHAAVLFDPDHDPEATVPCARAEAASDPADFIALARVLATGSGKVHRVSVSRQDFDMTGLELIDESAATVAPQHVGDPLMVSDDWYALALRELAQENHVVPNASGSDDTWATTQRHLTAAPAPVQGAYVAPVVGPSLMSQTDAQRRRSMIEQAASPAAAALRDRDEAFRAQRPAAQARPFSPARPQTSVPAVERERPVAQARPPMPACPQTSVPSVEAERPAPLPAVASRAAQRPVALNAVRQASAPAVRQGGVRVEVTKDGIPIISRGADLSGTPGPVLRARSVSDAVAVPARSVNVPELEQSSPALMAAHTYLDYVEPSLEAAVAAASAAYANFAPAPTSRPVVSTPRRAEAASAPHTAMPAAQKSSGADVAGSVAAAYAAAVYANVQAPEPVRETPDERKVPAVSEETARFAARYDDIRYDYSLSQAYIDYMVQEEFEHRHDTPAQRNAALGRMRIVNGAAHAPVSIKEGLNLRRHMA